MSWNSEHIYHVLQIVWATQFDSELELIETAETEIGDDWYCGAIAVHGEPPQQLVVACDAPMTQMILSQLLGNEADVVDQEACDDMVCEIANIVAGNLRGVGSPQQGLCTPQNLPAREVRLSAKSPRAQRMECQSGDGRMVVLWWKAIPSLVVTSR